ncbi:hypothetical protein OPT61_g3080 [Boeremia exigua]|uniref:Uncharacterized protein n=1 Tax=Boeremia exigua TaxID=749465 RepID=A0ACC2IJF1_9PLEO|nr:hypothetical protein OPT61_g3080 [Boeremia exigua]
MPAPGLCSGWCYFFASTHDLPGNGVPIIDNDLSTCVGEKFEETRRWQKAAVNAPLLGDVLVRSFDAKELPAGKKAARKKATEKANYARTPLSRRQPWKAGGRSAINVDNKAADRSASVLEANTVAS